jgi:hypothetical protein
MSAPIIVVQVILGLLFVSIGGMTVAGMNRYVENFRRFGYPQWFRIVTGSLEVLGGLGPPALPLVARVQEGDSPQDWRCSHATVAKCRWSSNSWSILCSMIGR